MEKEDKLAIKREPPAEVTRILREEVGFGCPVPDCRVPFLTWHHFDPPWHERNHHDPQGMIALCTRHHPMADRGVFDKGQLRAFKNARYSVKDVKAKFEWARPKQLIRLGDFYMGWNQTMFIEAGWFKEAIIGLHENSVGLLELSFILRDKRMNKIAAMENNMFVASPDRVFDLQVDTGATKIKIRERKGKLLLDLHSSRKTPEELLRLLKKDTDQAIKTMNKKVASNSSTTGPVFRNYLFGRMIPIEEEHDGQHATYWRDESTGEVVDARQYHISFIHDWAMKYSLDAEGLIPILDFQNVLSHVFNDKYEIRNGIDVGPQKAYTFGAKFSPDHLHPSDRPGDLGRENPGILELTFHFDASMSNIPYWRCFMRRSYSPSYQQEVFSKTRMQPRIQAPVREAVLSPVSLALRGSDVRCCGDQ